MTITPEQKIAAYHEIGSVRGAARKLGVDQASVYRTLKRLGVLNTNIPIDHKIKGVSTLVDESGNQKLQWIKTDQDKERALMLMREACEALKEEIKPYKPVKYKGTSSDDLATCYILTDYHIGQLSWCGETGEKWDIETAENMLIDWFASAIKDSPSSDTAILAQLGDFLHHDSLSSITPTSHHVLDADARYQEMVGVAVRAINAIIKMLLEKHKNVHIIMAEGNHDIASSVWLRILLAEKYRDEPRVTVDNTHTPFYAFEWGLTSLFFHHGHKRKMGNISEVFASMFRGIFGRTKYSYVHMGHMHHIDVKENSMMTVEQHPTMAGKDAHASRLGLHSNRGASAITYHKKFGEVKRSITRPEMLS